MSFTQTMISLLYICFWFVSFNKVHLLKAEDLEIQRIVSPETTKVCPETNAIYDVEQGKCIGRLNRRFSASYPCKDWNTSIIDCGANAECRWEICTCIQGAFPVLVENDSPALHCFVRGYGESCNNSSVPCSTPYVCSLDGICGCRSGGVWNSNDSLCYSDYYCNQRRYGTIYDSNSGSCVMKLNFPVQLSENEILSCPVNAMKTGPPTRNICKCIEGYTPETLPRFEGRVCVASKQYGESCSIKPGGGGDNCNKDERTICVGGICKCTASYSSPTWDKRSGKCSIRVGFDCTNIDEPNTYVDSCVSTSICQPSLRWSNCVCPDGYARTDEGGCAAEYMTSCNRDDICIEGLGCVNGRCQCRNLLSQIYDSQSKMCRGLVGSTCDSSGDTSSCADASFCNSTSGRCECDKDLYNAVASNKARCINVAGFGETCTISNGTTCNYGKGYACVDGKCSCSDTALIFHDDKKGCLAPIGTKCGAFQVDAECRSTRITCEHYMVSCEPNGVCQQIGANEGTCVAKDHDDKGVVATKPGP